MIVYHGGYCVIEKPEIHISKNKKDFGHGFYCTGFQAQADKWAKRFDTPTYKCTPAALDCLKYLKSYEVRA